MVNQLKEHWCYFFIFPLFLAALCTAFVKHNGINIIHKEVLLAYFWLILLGLLPGLIMVFGGLILRLLTVSGLLIFFILTQYNGLLILPLGLQYRYVIPFFLLLFTIPLYFLREQLDKLLLVMFSVFLVGSFFTNPITLFSVQNYSSTQTKEAKKLPPYIEIVLDELIGIQGGQLLEKDGHYFSKDLIGHYKKQGFTIYGNAYSRDFQTLSSFASFLNFKPINNLDSYLVQDNGVNLITQNKLFEALTKKGYEINLVQSTYVDMCKYKNQINLKKCSTYNYASPVPYGFVDYKQKSIDIIYTIFFTIPQFKEATRRLFSFLFKYKNEQTFVEASTATYFIFPEVLQMAKDVQRGNAYFVHLLIPHYPYVFNAHCDYLGNRGKTAATYLEQLKCAHKMISDFLAELANNPEAAESTIVVHGDHGFRIPKPSAKASYKFSDKRIITIYNTFFAVKAPFQEAGYKGNELPIDYLLKNIIARKPIDSYDPKHQYVYLRSDKHTDVPFDKGKGRMPQNLDNLL